MSTKARIFISYKRRVEPDAPLARTLFETLSREHTVFLDEELPIGTAWAQAIETQIREADFLIVLLSKHSAQSHMVVAEIQLARRFAAAQGGRPRILPIRLDREPLPYPLSAYLNPIQAAFWSNSDDTAPLLDKLRAAMAHGAFTPTQEPDVFVPPQTGPLPQPHPIAQPLPIVRPCLAKLEAPEGTMPVDSAFYIERDSDALALRALDAQGVTVTVKGARQMGKSSLLNRLIAKAASLNKQVAYLDFQLFERTALQDAEVFLRQFCYWLTDQLGIEDQLQQHWTSALGPVQCCTRYLRRYVLPQLTAPVVFAFDEVDAILDAPFRSDFFGMLRNWHNNRAIDPVWRNLDLVLVVSTEPYQLISDLNQSPFNVGTTVELEDFNAEQVAELNRRYGTPFAAEELGRLIQLVAGHPYLTRRALHLVATRQSGSTGALLALAADDQGPFGDHLRHHLFRLHDEPELIDGLLKVIKNQSRLDDLVFFRLRGAGLVKRVGNAVVPRCQIYVDYFTSHLGR